MVAEQKLMRALLGDTGGKAIVSPLDVAHNHLFNLELSHITYSKLGCAVICRTLSSSGILSWFWWTAHTWIVRTHSRILFGNAAKLGLLRKTCSYQDPPDTKLYQLQLVCKPNTADTHHCRVRKQIAWSQYAYSERKQKTIVFWCNFMKHAHFRTWAMEWSECTFLVWVPCSIWASLLGTWRMEFPAALGEGKVSLLT